MGVTSEYLIVNENGSKASTWQMIQRIFEPFSLSLWAVTFAVLIALSLLFALQESAASSLSAFKEKPISFTVNAVYSALLRFWSQETMLPTDGRYGNGAVQTWSGRFTLLAIGVQLLLTGASYTANLTTFLIRTGFTPTVSSMDDAIEQQFKVRMFIQKREPATNLFGIPNMPVLSHSPLFRTRDLCAEE